MNTDDERVIQQVRAHHAAMAASLQRRAAAVAQAEDGHRLAEALAAFLEYWDREVLPHAKGEESTIYAAAARLPEARLLVRALEHEHADLARRGSALRARHAQAAGGEPGHGRAAAMEAAAAAAVFAVHAEKENDVLLPALAAAGQALPEVLLRMEAAFGEARRAAQRAPHRPG